MRSKDLRYESDGISRFGLQALHGDPEVLKTVILRLRIKSSFERNIQLAILSTSF